MAKKLHPQNIPAPKDDKTQEIMRRAAAEDIHGNSRGFTAQDMRAMQRNDKAEEWKRYRKAMRKAASRGGDAWNRANEPFSEATKVSMARNGFIDAKDVGGASAVHQSAALSNMSVKYANDEFIGDRLLPRLDVAHKSDSYYIYTKRDSFAWPDDKVAERGEPNEVQNTRTTGSYTCVDYALKDSTPVTELMNQDAPLNEFLDAQETVLEGLAFNRELRQATLLTTSGNYGATSSPGTKWDAASGSVPITNIQTAVAGTFRGAGASQLLAFCSLDIYNTLARHADIRDLFKYTAPGLATPDMVASFFGLDGLLVGAARKETANEGQTASYSRIWGDFFGVLHTSETATIRNAIFGKTIWWTGVDGSNPTFDSQTLNMEKGVAGVWTIKSGYSATEELVAGDTGYLLTDVLT